ncbi:MAG: transposase [Rhodospirillales bacterium]|nr:transposase [Rhodospirillales bacterium]
MPRARRRRWSSSENASLVEESLAPGAMVAAVAWRHDVHPNLPHHWCQQAKRAADGGGLAFLPVAVTPAAQPKAAGSIEIELGGAGSGRCAGERGGAGAVLRALGVGR